MRVWRLAARLVWRTLRGRGADMVYVRLDGLSEPANDEQGRAAWVLHEVFGTRRGPRPGFVVMSGRPASEVDTAALARAWHTALNAAAEQILADRFASALAAYGEERAAQDLAGAARCRVCGCTEDAPCPAGCVRPPDPQLSDLCSRCVGQPEVDKLLAELTQLDAQLQAARADREMWFAPPDPACGDGATVEAWQRWAAYWHRRFLWSEDTARRLDDRLARAEGRPVAAQYQVGPPARVAAPVGRLR